jgi:hypothetical protein
LIPCYFFYLKKRPLERFNEIHLFTDNQYHPKEAPCQNRKSYWTVLEKCNFSEKCSWNKRPRGLTAPLFNHNYILIITLAGLWNPYEVYHCKSPTVSQIHLWLSSTIYPKYTDYYLEVFWILWSKM